MMNKKENILKMLRGLKNEDGATLKNYKSINYRTGYQVATEGIEAETIEEAAECVEKFGGNCGLWFYDGVYYIDKSKRVPTLKEALEIGRECHQTSILKWSDMSLIYL